MYSTLRIVILVFAVLGLASLASAATCFGIGCVQSGCGPGATETCGTCIKANVGTIEIIINDDLECDQDGTECQNNCSSPDTLRAQSTIYYTKSVGLPRARDVLVCEMLFDCVEEDIICKECTELNMTPASPPDVKVMDQFKCEDVPPGQYQYVVHAVDVEGQDCPCIEDPCEAACAASCDPTSWYAWAISCCLDW
ncbi:hypothetical protein ACFLU6_12200 [Acidobacteriota bacterium]